MSPQLLVGVASPLWSYFGAAASAGVAYWWMTRWARPANLEALFGGRALAPDMVIDTVAAELEPVGGESAPISPVLEALADDVVEPPPAPVAEVLPEEPPAEVANAEAAIPAVPLLDAVEAPAPTEAKIKPRKSIPSGDADA
ncbi:hypothetical protein [Phenylobacterium kunshanense]|uniref:Uncharacterized protein n=1 Tax=Phenylobacterium kunshanense TaxID=1445034 RepID=A0A328B613_9CAUL|nr:hypothetical protein [Phenylobacterium kunshanense]RAK62319.1 hypothetical protein DJ019_19515 [Phenylobacterium kunshanense]